MAILQKFVATLLISTFVLSSALCLCEAKAAIESTDSGPHAHHTSQAETGDAQACPHVDCDGDCATLSNAKGNDPANVAISWSLKLDEPLADNFVLADLHLFGGSPIHSFVLHAPPPPHRTTPVSRFDRILA